MLRARRERGIPALLGVAAFALAFAQRPGLATADTKINLHVDPVRFLGDVASMWTSTGQLGGVQTGQQAGYLFPMGPFFALGRELGITDWVVQRLWLGALLALAAWGVVRLLDAMLDRPRGAGHLIAGAVILLNPFVVTYVNRTTVTLLAYAALPWLLLAVLRGLRDPAGWRWPAVVALLVTASGSGVNGAVTAWMLVGPALLLVHEVGVGSVAGRSARGFLLRAVPLTALTSLWWLIPAYVQSAYGVDFLRFTEQPGTVWGTTSATESLRLMSFWLSYVGIGFAGRAIPYFDDADTLLFTAPVVVATLLLPAVALTGFVWTRRWRYGPFFLGLALLAVLIMMAGFPAGTPLRHGLSFTYNHVAAVRFLRGSYKAAPLLAVSLACLAGAGAAELLGRLGARRNAGRLLWRGLGATTGLAILALAAWPMVTGHAQDGQVSYRRVPAAWEAAAADLNRQLPANSRAIVLPGDLFSFYTWGGTVDPILPALSRRPVVERSEVPYSDLRATDLLWTIDGLVHQARLLPGQLEPLLSLISVRSVITPTDDDLARSDAPAPADAAAALATQPELRRPARVYGPVHTFATTVGLAPAQRLHQIRRYDLPDARGLVRVEPAADPIVVDGSAPALADLAAFGQLKPSRPLLYAGDLSVGQLRTTLATGGELVISDSNRRQAFVAASLGQNAGPVLTADQTVSADGIVLDPFQHGSGDQTVATYTGIRSVQAPASPERVQFPEHGPYAALDGSTATAWIADPTLDPGQRWLQVNFERARAVSAIDLLPYGDAGGQVRAVQVNGRSFAVHPGWNHLAVGLRATGALRVAITAVSGPTGGAKAGAGGISELRIPGARARQALRLPTDAAAALAGRDLARVGITYLFQRTTADHPFQRDLAHGPWSALAIGDAGDAEQTMHRTFTVPAARRFSATAWVSTFSDASDSALDHLAGYHGSVRAISSSRFDGEPRWRASAALDGDRRTAWIADGAPGSVPWLQWSAPRMMSVTALRLLAPDQPVRRPTAVRLLWPGGATPVLPVSSAGEVVMPRPIHTRLLRLEVIRSRQTPGGSTNDARAVGIAEIQGVRGLPRVIGASGPRFSTPCGSVSLAVGGHVLAMRVDGTAAAFERGAPLPGVGCGPRQLSAGVARLDVAPGAFAVDTLRLRSAPPIAAAVRDRDAVLDSGTAGRGSYDHVRVRVGSPSWLVLGEGYDRGWQAFCNGRALGAPVPVDGFANGWRVGPGCHDVRLAFAPSGLALSGYLVSAVVALLCLAVLVGAWWRRRRRARADPAPDAAGASAAASAAPGPAAFESEPARLAGEARALPWRSTLIGSVIAAAAFGFVFGARAGLVALPVLVLALRVGIGAGPLAIGAGLLLGVAVPVLYLAHPDRQPGGNQYTYPLGHLGAHWLGVAALGLLMLALWRSLPRRTSGSRRRFGARRRGTDPPSAPD